jgi:hypothetical protein
VICIVLCSVSSYKNYRELTSSLMIDLKSFVSDFGDYFPCLISDATSMDSLSVMCRARFFLVSE